MSLNKPLPHPRALAHLGDAVYELWVRERALLVCSKANDLHRYTIQRVKGETQVQLLEMLMPELNEEELDVVRRAQNIPVTTGRRSNHAVYRKATGFEALVGYWYLTDIVSINAKRDLILPCLDKLFPA